jgi:hypothetical protein
MKFWKQLRLIGSLIALAISVLAIVLAALRTPQADDEDALTRRPARTLTPQSGTTGLDFTNH